MLVIANYEEALRPLGLGTMEGVKSFRGELIKNHKGKRDIQRITTEAGDRTLVLFLKRIWCPYKKDGFTSLLTRGAVWSLSSRITVTESFMSGKSRGICSRDSPRTTS